MANLLFNLRRLSKNILFNKILSYWGSPRKMGHVSHLLANFIENLHKRKGKENNKERKKKKKEERRKKTRKKKERNRREDKEKKENGKV